MPDTMKPDRHVFVSYAREDLERVRPFVAYLEQARGLRVFWDQHVELGVPFRRVIDEACRSAACVVVLWTSSSVRKDWVASEVDQAWKDGVVVPVLLDHGVRIPSPFSELQHADLTGWDGTETPALRRVGDRVEKLLARATRSAYEMTLADRGAGANTGYAVQNAGYAISAMRDATSGARSAAEALASDVVAGGELREALDEVGKTYRAVTAAISRFVTPAVGKGAIDAAPYVDMERGTLAADVENGRGHCTRIRTLYARPGGLRDLLLTKLDPKAFGEADRAFASLAVADGDLFEPLTRIGRVLTNESRAVVNLLVDEQEAAARRRILDGRRELAEVEQQLATAMAELQQVGASVGYAAAAVPKGN